MSSCGRANTPSREDEPVGTAAPISVFSTKQPGLTPKWPAPAIDEMHFPLTHEHIGDATSVTGTHVNRILRDFCNDRILELHDRRLRIFDPDRLLAVAPGCPH